MHIANLHCEHCVEHIQGTLQHVAGVEEVRGDPAQHQVTIRYREGEADPGGIRAAIIEQGFTID